MEVNIKKYILSILILLIFSNCGMFNSSQKILKTIEENAVTAIEFFPSYNYQPSPDQKPPRIHYNFKYGIEGGDLVILVDDWQFIEGRKNYLRVYHIPLSNIDPSAIEIDRITQVGPISYKGENIEIEPCRVILQTEDNSIRLEIYDRGSGSSSNRWIIPSENGETSFVKFVEIYAPNQQRAQNIADIFQE